MRRIIMNIIEEIKFWLFRRRVGITKRSNEEVVKKCLRKVFARLERDTAIRAENHEFMAE
jgi:hypothetical protein